MDKEWNGYAMNQQFPPTSKGSPYGYEMDISFERGRNTNKDIDRIWSTDIDRSTKKKSDNGSQSDKSGDQSSVSDEKNGMISFLQYGLTTFTVIIFLSGAGILGLGIYLMAYDYAPQDISIAMGDKLYQAAALIMLISGGCIVFLALCGFCGSARSSKMMLGFFIICIGILTVALLAGGIMAFVFKERMKNDMEPILLNSYGQDGSTRLTLFWDFMQKSLNCCGVSGDTSTPAWKIYQKSAWKKTSGNNDIPDSCCQHQVDLTTCKTNATIYANQIGCYDKLANIIKFNSVLVGACSLAAMTALVFVLVFAVCLFRQLHQKK